MKKFLLVVLCAVAVWAGAATIQWYSDQTAATSLSDTDVLALERPSPHAYKSFTLLALKGYIGTNGTFVTLTFYGSNVYHYTTYTTNLLVTSNAYFFETNFVAYNYTTNMTVVNNSFMSNVYVTNLYSEFITNNYLYTTNVTAKNVTVVNNFSSQTNYLGDLTVTNGITNLSLTPNRLVGTDANKQLVSTDTVVVPLLSLSPTTNGPSANEFATAGWVRGLFQAGADYYNTTNIDIGATNPAQPNQVVYKFQSTIPLPSARSYTTSDFLTNGGYLGGVVTTNTFQSLGGTVVIDAYLGFTGGVGGPTLTVHPEIYYSYDKTNWYGDFSGSNENIVSGATNLYQWAISFAPYTSTNANGFYIQRRFRVGTVTGAGVRTLTVLIGTNLVSGVSTAGHITMESPDAASGDAFLVANQTFTGDNNFSANVRINNLTLTNSAFRFITAWPGPTNVLKVNTNFMAFETYTPCAITQFVGGVAGFAADCQLQISNASTTNIVVWVTAANSRSGDYTNAYVVTNTDVLDLGIQNINGSWTKYLSRGFH